ncbi:unnamed protein product [Brassica rapa]|uniref:Replication protein A 70 kDa DNA-binding subunit B/D first OB fold domain-containing protein n=1 Tax=Brassica campestris TaxID=3711 RepID=A0A8D9GRG9_BRACM|nr:unnamed protein product [Brassica rapa]
MANNVSLTPVKDLKPFKTKWRSQVKVLLHSWLQNTGFGLQILLTDEQGEKISATCKRNHILSVQRKLPLGKWRVLTTFSVSQASGQYRPTSHPYKITISDETVITNSDLIQDSIFLSLARYEDIIDGTVKTNFLIGNTYILEPVQTVQVKGQDRKKFNFVWLMQSNGKDLACCLWGKYAEQLEAYVEHEPLICLIRFSKISFYKGIFYACKSKILLMHPLFILIQLWRKHYSWWKTSFLLLLLRRKMERKKSFLQEDDWNKLEINMISELFVANILHLIVRDDTETCKLMSLNTVAKTIVGHEAVDLWDGSYNEIEDPELLPEPIRALEGKSFCFGISVNSDNVRDGAGTYKVLEVWSGDHILKVESQSEPTSMIGTSSSTLSSGDVLMLEGNSQNDPEECKTPFAKWKEEDADLPDITSTSKKLCTSIKVEKEKEE